MTIAQLRVLTEADCQNEQISLFARTYRMNPDVDQLCTQGDYQQAERACDSGGHCAPEGSFDTFAECIIQIAAFDIRRPGVSDCIIAAGDDCPAVLMCVPEDGDEGGQDNPGEET